MQKGDYEFVVRTSNKEKIHAFVILLTILTILLILSSLVAPKLFTYWLSGDENKSIFSLAKEKLTDVSPFGLLLMSFFGGSIFIPMPIELFYWLGLTNGSTIWLSFLAINMGFILMQLVNYWIGLKLSYFFFTFVSKRKVYSIRRKVNSYGSWSVFLLNVTPSPSELLTFALGITRYNKTRLFIVLSFANLLKFTVITFFYIFFFR